MKKRITTRIKTRDDLERVAGEYADAVNEEKTLTAELEKEIIDLRQRYEKRVAVVKTRMDELFEDMSNWAQIHTEEFDKKKSIELLHAVIGFRTTPPSVKQLRGVPVQNTIESLTVNGKTDWLSEKVTVNKQKILSDVSQGLAEEADLKRYGLWISRDETFFAEAKQETRDA